MSQQQVDAYRQQLLASYYYQQQQQQWQQQLASTPNYYYNMSPTPAKEPGYMQSPSTMALLSDLQQQYQQEQQQQQRQLTTASTTPSHAPASPLVLSSHQYAATGEDRQRHVSTPSQAQAKEPAVTASCEPASNKAQKLKKKKSFLARIAESNKNLGPKDPSFWSPREDAQAKRFGKEALKEARKCQTKKESISPAPAPTPAPTPTPASAPAPATASAQYQPQALPPYQAPAAAAPPSIPPPPFALPQIPAGGYLYYCPPTPLPEATPPPAPAPAPAPETGVAQKPVYRVSATVYNPRQGNPGDRCSIM
ncbi:hypothetical protein BX666DRAFT_1880440 [Dichotomocladium elegans]|nr:hypothetical protein BX666DRAFT_1880440 [Dichotomocladium elegans]